MTDELRELLDVRENYFGRGGFPSWEEWQAIRAYLEADDPEPQTSCSPKEMSISWSTWRNRQELKAKIVEVLR